MPEAGIEPAWPFGQGILSPPRLPFRHPGASCKKDGAERTRRVRLRLFYPRAGNGTRTRDPNLGKVVLYQLSYSRVRES